MTFKEQIKHPKWQKKRLEILQRDEFMCVNCGCDYEMLHIHHFLYKKDKMLWEYEDGYLATLCDDCHSDWHTINNQIKEFLCVDTTVLREFYEIFDLIKKMNLNHLSDVQKLIKKYVDEL